MASRRYFLLPPLGHKAGLQPGGGGGGGGGFFPRAVGGGGGGGGGPIGGVIGAFCWLLFCGTPFPPGMKLPRSGGWFVPPKVDVTRACSWLVIWSAAQPMPCPNCGFVWRLLSIWFTAEGVSGLTCPITLPIWV